MGITPSHVHSLFSTAIQALRTAEWNDVGGAQPAKGGIGAARAAVEQCAALIEDPAFRDSSYFAKQSLVRLEAQLDAGELVTEESFVQAMSVAESSLLQLRELAARFVGRRTFHGPGEIVRASKARAVIAQLRILLEVTTEGASTVDKARLAGNGLANLLGMGSERLLSIQDRFLLSRLQKRLHAHLVAVAQGAGDAGGIQRSLSDLLSSMELLMAQLGTELREHDRTIVVGALASLEAGDLSGTLFALRSVRGFDADLDMLLTSPSPSPAELHHRLSHLVADLSRQPSFTELDFGDLAPASQENGAQ